MQFLTSKALSRKSFEQRKKMKIKKLYDIKMECLSTEKEWKMKKLVRMVFVLKNLYFFYTYASVTEENFTIAHDETQLNLISLWIFCVLRKHTNTVYVNFFFLVLSNISHWIRHGDAVTHLVVCVKNTHTHLLNLVYRYNESSQWR